MNDMIKQMVQPMLDAFNMYQIKSPALQKEVDDFKIELTTFADKYTDMMAYYTDFASSGLQAKYTDIISKVAVSASMSDIQEDDAGAGSAGAESGGQESAIPKITVKDFLEQYRVPYEELCKRGSIRGRKAYEEIFNVANRTDDMLEAQIILEKERLLWKIIPEDAIEVLENKLQEMDPLYLATTAVLIGQIDAYNQVKSEEELEYRLALAERDSWRVIAEYTFKMNIAAMLSKETIEYIKAKEMVYSWFNDNAASKGVGAMLAKKQNIQSLLEFMKVQLGLTPGDLFDDPGVAIWMLSPQNVDEYGRKKKAVNPELLRTLRDTLENEIIADLSPVEALKR